MLDNQQISSFLITFIFSPLTALLGALIFQFVTRIACGFIPNYKQAYIATLLSFILATISGAMAAFTLSFFGIQEFIIAGLSILSGIFVTLKIISNTIKINGEKIGDKKAIHIIFIWFLILLEISIFIILILPTILGYKGISQNVIIGSSLLFIVIVSFIFTLYRSHNYKKEQY